MSKKLAQINQMKAVAHKGGIAFYREKEFSESVKLVTESGRTLFEMRGHSSIGRPKTSKKKSEFLGKFISQYRKGSNAILFWKDEYGGVHLTNKGGVHNTSYDFTSSHERRDLYFQMTRAFGYKISKHRDGGYYIYVGKK